MTNMLQEHINNIIDQVIAYRRHLHRHPEPSGREEATARWLATQCRRLGLIVREHIGGHGICARMQLDPGLPWLALRADIDALPIREQTGLAHASCHDGLAHACGHDAHSAMLLGAAATLRQLRQHLRCNLMFIFQPAEETCTGATAMLADGLFSEIQPEFIFALHVYPDLPAGTVGLRRGVMCAAADLFEVTIEGRGGHAARPHECTDTILIASHMIQALHHIISRRIDAQHPAVLTIGEIHAGHAANILPDKARFAGTVRTFHPEIHETIRAHMQRIIHQTAESWGATAHFSLKQASPVLVNDPLLVDACAEVFAQYLPACRQIELDQPSLGGEDFAEFLRKIPGALFRLGTGAGPQTRYPLHHPRFDIEENAMREGVGLLCALALAFPHLQKRTASPIHTLC
ncbi:MAG: amidohydrolase [Zetaproteobacteria bacterium]|nr:MAG: amidohydrolase [Zetaproteobacteria bacterium]